MTPEIDRVRNDLETMQKALGLPPGMGREWVQWMRRDQWFSLWWCLPGLILIATTLTHFEPVRHAGLLPVQWEGLLAAATMLVVTAAQMRRVTANDGRPEGLIREAKRINGLTTEGLWPGMAFAAQAVLYFVWCRHFQIAFEACWTGFFLLMGTTYLVAALAARVWQLLGWAIPLLGYGLCLLVVGGHGKLSGVLLGLMFIAIALSFSVISTLEIRQLERQK